MIFQIEEMILTYFIIFPIEMPKTKICNNIAVTRNEYMVGPGARLLQRKQTKHRGGFSRSTFREVRPCVS